MAPWLMGVAVLLAFTHGYPLLMLMQRALSREGRISLENIHWLLETSRVHLALRHSLWVSAVSTGLALMGGLVLAVITTQTDLPGRGILRVLFLSPLVIPPQVLALAWIQWAGPVGYLQQGLRLALGRQGALWSLYTPGGIILLLSLFTLPIVYLTLVSGLSRLQKQTEEAARLDGANLLQVWLYVTLPLLRPYIGAAAVLAFLGALGNFGIPALLAIPGRYTTLPTLLYQEVINFSGDGFGRSAALAVLFGLPAILFLGLQQRGRGQEGLDPSHEPPERYRLGWERWWWSGILMGLTLLVIVGPLLAMASTALLRAYGLPLLWSNLTLEHFRFVIFDLERARRATVHSLGLASGSAVLSSCIAVILGYALTRLKMPLLLVLSLIVDLPYALPGIIFALSLILVWLPSPLPGLTLYGTLWLILIAYLGRFLAFSLQPIQAAWRSLDTSLEEAANIDGANLIQSFRYILLPLLTPALAAAMLLVFLQSFAELTLSALLVGSGTETLGWLVFGLQQGGYTHQAAALSTLLVLTLFAVAAGIHWLKPNSAKLSGVEEPPRVG
ncbi:iron ABC transporter permease [Synechococcus sp. Nb3U1]|uniref:ABC transporter permease n=1 Tax=Synechococcus sp. Nb3U1 TaxID=1914529 RepID=UPI001F20D6B7|nr:iron ABC transporter permease [Synechococcus sp. Nb3U1]MCF2971827.1 iron ABC transporter permease [Synechococcus sp. Nb3U1]